MTGCKPFPAQLTTRRQPSSAKPLFNTAITDLSERHRAEADRRAMEVKQQRAQAASEAKDRFLAMLSHELRTPLTPVLAAVTSLDTGTLQSGRLRDILSMIRRNIELEARLIDDLLDMTRISRGKLSLEMSVVDLHAVVREVEEMCCEEIAARNLRVERELAAREHHVRGDPARLRQVVWNLLKNAVKFTPRGGQVTVCTRNPAPGRVVLTVRDTGVGIASDMLDKIFMPFEQLATDTHRAPGLGLGLFISKTLVQAHGGDIRADSGGEGKGTKFDVALDTVPAPSSASSESKPAPASVPGPSGGQRVRILLVEDHADTAELMGALLRREGYELRIAHSVRDAVAEAQNGVDLVISDLGLPDGSGLDLIRKLHEKQPPVRGIVLSGFGSDEDIRKSREAGFDEHLTKPVDFTELCDVIQHLAPGNANPSSAPPA